jgi:hemolysin activation/secretion protein
MGLAPVDHSFGWKAHMLKIFWAPCLVGLVSLGALAQTVPSAGGLMQQMPAVPSLPNPAPRVEVTPSDPALAQPERAAVFVVQRLNVSGATAYTPDQLLTVANFQAGREMSLQDLYAMAFKITRHYRREGFLVARAYLPAQEVKDGVVNLVVLEGHYGQITVNNTSGLNSQVPRQWLRGLNPGDAILAEPLESRLLHLSDVPGVQVRSTLVPGASVGLSDLVVEVQPGAPLSGSVDADNAGNRYTGENRLGVTLHLNNPAGLGDLATFRALTSGAGLLYGRLAYQIPVGKGQVGVAYSDLAYTLQREFKRPDANGHAQVVSWFGSYPLIRSRHTNLNAGLTLDTKRFDDHSTASHKHVQVATASLTGDRRDAWGGGGLNSYSLAWSTGHLDIRTPDARASDATTAQSNGDYNKLSFAASRLQQSTPTLSFLASVRGQVASKNLDASEKMELGGMHAVRAYPEGEAFGDEGYLVTLEGRQQLPWPSNPVGKLHAVAFIDAGEVQLSHTPAAEGRLRRHLSGAGVGLYWTHAHSFSVKAFYARKLGNELAVSAPDKSGRFWIQAVKYF